MVNEIAKGRRAATIADVVNMMTALDREWTDRDGLWWFNRLYLRVTLSVLDAVATTKFRDPKFLEQLDVVFANLYFDAVANGNADPRAAPAAWRPLFECRARDGVDKCRSDVGAEDGADASGRILFASGRPHGVCRSRSPGAGILARRPAARGPAARRPAKGLI
jgi:Family of unknown function (DUF5995)